MYKYGAEYGAYGAELNTLNNIVGLPTTDPNNGKLFLCIALMFSKCFVKSRMSVMILVRPGYPSDLTHLTQIAQFIQPGYNIGPCLIALLLGGSILLDQCKSKETVTDTNDCSIREYHL